MKGMLLIVVLVLFSGCIEFVPDVGGGIAPVSTPVNPSQERFHNVQSLVPGLAQSVFTDANVPIDMKQGRNKGYGTYIASSRGKKVLDTQLIFKTADFKSHTGTIIGQGYIDHYNNAGVFTHRKYFDFDYYSEWFVVNVEEYSWNIVGGVTGQVTCTLTNVSSGTPCTLPQNITITSTNTTIFGADKKITLVANGSLINNTGSTPIQFHTDISGFGNNSATIQTFVNGTRVAYEKEALIGNNISGFHIPNVNTGADYTLELIGNTINGVAESRSSAYGSCNAWDVNFTTVLHMNAALLNDSTCNNNNGTAIGNISIINGSFQQGVNFNGTDNAFTLANAFTMPGAFTTEVFANLDNTAPEYSDDFVGQYVSADDFLNFEFVATNEIGWHVQQTGNSDRRQRTDNNNVVVETDQYYVLSKTGDDDVDVFIDGTEEATRAASTTDDWAADNRIAGRTESGRNHYVDGKIYEIRQSDIKRTAGFITTINNNFNNPTATGTTPFYKSKSAIVNLSFNTTTGIYTSSNSNISDGSAAHNLSESQNVSEVTPQWEGYGNADVTIIIYTTQDPLQTSMTYSNGYKNGTLYINHDANITNVTIIANLSTASVEYSGTISNLSDDVNVTSTTYNLTHATWLSSAVNTSVTHNYNYSVPVNNASINAQANQTCEWNLTCTITTSASDVDNNTINYSTTINGTQVYGANPEFTNTTQLSIGTHDLLSNVTDKNGTIEDLPYPWSNLSKILTVSDTIAPSPVTNLANTSGEYWVNWTWTNPTESDWNHTEVWINSVRQVNSSNPYYNWTSAEGLTVNVELKSADVRDNVNTTTVTDSVTMNTTAQANQIIGGW